MIYKPGAWDLPGGHLAANETFEEGLAREVAEETASRSRSIGCYVRTKLTEPIYS